MKIKDKVILPMSYFGPIQYYRLIQQYDVLIESKENYQKRSVRNRATILSANGPQTLSIPLQKGKTNLLITQVKIAYHHDWQSQHIRSLKAAYGSAPYFEYFIDEIENILKSRYIQLYELNIATMTWICQTLNLPIPALTTEYFNNPHDLMIDGREQTMLWNTQRLSYNQVFEEKYGFVDGLSVLDLIFNLGPAASVMVKA